MTSVQKRGWRTALVILLLWGGCDAVAEGGRPTYEESRPPLQTEGVWEEDNNIWVYTSDFARRFGMPEAWIDDTLVGAEAAAYRYEVSNEKSCGFFRDQNNCRYDDSCRLELYISKTAHIPMKSNLAYLNSYRYFPDSFSKTFPQVENESIHYHQEKIYKHDKIFPYAVWVTSTEKGFGPFKKHLLGFHSGGVDRFDKRLFRDMDYYSLWIFCSFPKDDLDVVHETWFAEPELKIRQDLFRKPNPPPVDHRVTYPRSFLERVLAFRKNKYDKNSLENEVINRLKNNGMKGLIDGY